MRKILTVTILFCLIVSSFVVPSFADNGVTFDTAPNNALLPVYVPVNSSGSARYQEMIANGYQVTASSSNPPVMFTSSDSDYVYMFCYYYDGWSHQVAASPLHDNFTFYTGQWLSTNYSSGGVTYTNVQYDSTTGLYYIDSGGNSAFSSNSNIKVPYYTYKQLSYGLQALKSYLDLNPPVVYTKNPNVDAFLANTLISCGFKFSTSSDALGCASALWNWMIDENNYDVPRGGWNVDSAVSYCNAQSNNYKDWYNGYKVSAPVMSALKDFLYHNYADNNNDNLGTLAGYNVQLFSSYLPNGMSVNVVNNNVSLISGFGNSNANSFYTAQTNTYFNGSYLNANDNINSLQFVYTPDVVRKFIAYPPAPVINYEPNPDGTSGTGTLTDDGNGGYDFNINFPSFQWLADAINSLLNFLGNLLTTVSNFLSKIIDTLESLFSDAFESLSEFGQGFLDFIQGIWDGTVTLGNGVLPSSLWSVIQPFLMLAIGIGLLKFILRAH